MDSSVLKCTECEVILKYSDIIYSIPQCGHLFHGTCLRKSSKCPKCESVSYARYQRRVYPEFSANNWIPIDIQSTPLDSEDCSAFALELGKTEKNQSIYAARLSGSDELVPLYYVPDERCCFHDITCTRVCTAEELLSGIEILDIRRNKSFHANSLRERSQGSFELFKSKI